MISIVLVQLVTDCLFPHFFPPPTFLVVGYVKRKEKKKKTMQPGRGPTSMRPPDSPPPRQPDFAFDADTSPDVRASIAALRAATAEAVQERGVLLQAIRETNAMGDQQRSILLEEMGADQQRAASQRTAMLDELRQRDNIADSQRANLLAHIQTERADAVAQRTTLHEAILDIRQHIATLGSRQMPIIVSSTSPTAQPAQPNSVSPIRATSAAGQVASSYTPADEERRTSVATHRAAHTAEIAAVADVLARLPNYTWARASPLHQDLCTAVTLVANTFCDIQTRGVAAVIADFLANLQRASPPRHLEAAQAGELACIAGAFDENQCNFFQQLALAELTVLAHPALRPSIFETVRLCRLIPAPATREAFEEWRTGKKAAVVVHRQLAALQLKARSGGDPSRKN